MLALSVTIPGNISETLTDFGQKSEIEPSNNEVVKLSRIKRDFPMFGFLSFLMLLANSVILIQQKISNNNNPRPYSAQLP